MKEMTIDHLLTRKAEIQDDIQKAVSEIIERVAEKEADLLKPETSIEAGAYILRTLIDTHGDIDGALRHYSGNARNYTDKVIGRVWG